MGKNRIDMNAENVSEWLAPLGYLFPKNSLELGQFEIIYGNYNHKLIDKPVDVDAIIEGIQSKVIGKTTLLEEEENSFQQLRMAARKGEAVPKEILEKMKRNQQKKRNGE